MNPRIHTTLAGTANPDNVTRNVRWTEEPMDQELLDGIQVILAPIKDQTWTLGRPENN
jgi:hypothetical protein